MTVLEALIAFMIAAGIIATTIGTSRLTASRAALASLDLEAAYKAEALVASVGAESPLRAGREEGTDGNGVSWTRDVIPAAEGLGNVKAFEVSASVRIRRGGLEASQDVATLKLVQAGRR